MNTFMNTLLRDILANEARHKRNLNITKPAEKSSGQGALSPRQHLNEQNPELQISGGIVQATLSAADVLFDIFVSGNLPFQRRLPGSAACA